MDFLFADLVHMHGVGFDVIRPKRAGYNDVEEVFGTAAFDGMDPSFPGFGIIVPIDRDKIVYADNGKYTSQDRQIITVAPLQIGDIVDNSGEFYKIDEELPYQQHTDVYIYFAKGQKSPGIYIKPLIPSEVVTKQTPTTSTGDSIYWGTDSLNAFVYSHPGRDYYFFWRYVENGTGRFYSPVVIAAEKDAMNTVFEEDMDTRIIMVAFTGDWAAYYCERDGSGPPTSHTTPFGENPGTFSGTYSFRIEQMKGV